MAVRYGILWLIHIIFCVATVHSILLDINDAESCDLLCKQCNTSAVFADDQCECNFSDNNDKGAECIQRIQREIQTIDLNTLSEDLTDEERSIRSIFKSRRRLGVGDADKVVQYFINGGPAAGHSHFIKTFDAYNNVDSATNSFSGVDENKYPENEFHGEKLLNNAIFWNTCDSPLYMVSEGHPTVPGVETPIIGIINPALSYPGNGLYGTINPLVGSIIHPYRQGHRLPLHHTLHRTNSLPGQILYNLFGNHRWQHHPMHHSFLRNSNDANSVSAGQSCENGDSSTAFKYFPTVKSNTDKSVEQNVAANFPASIESTHYSIQTPYIFSANTAHQPMQYPYFNVPYQYTSYRNPLINLLHPDEYIVQPEYIPQYVHGISDPLISAYNPNSYCTNNANVEQKDEVSTNKIVHSSNEAKQSNNNKEENKTEKNENNKS